MGLVRKVSPVKLIMGMISNNGSLFENVEKMLERKYDKIDFKSNIIDFNFTDYYTQEMGERLLRRFISFKKLIHPKELSGIKLHTNILEKKNAINSKRSINIDPGYLNEGKLILASTKDNLQRFYLSQGIYAEITLYYKDDNFQNFLWTYPDYRTQEYNDIFKQIRELFRKQIGR
ncbi:MAG: DUF4416 family protein [Candidatus Saelkia tenebricola]|nr:DUF4416 family protein [Candidatus Saelkia tenebricola]